MKSIQRPTRLCVWLSDEESNALSRSTKETGLSKSAYIRSYIMGYRPKSRPPAEYYEMTKQIRAIGNNLNQIALIANTTGIIDAEAYAANVRALDKKLLELQRKIELPDKAK